VEQPNIPSQPPLPGELQKNRGRLKKGGRGRMVVICAGGGMNSEYAGIGYRPSPANQGNPSITLFHPPPSAGLIEPLSFWLFSNPGCFLS